jgi:hypothetical protein
MSAFQAGKCTAQPHQKLASTIAKSVVIVEVNNNKQPLPPCYPSKVSVHYQPKPLPVLEHICNLCEITARILIISMLILFSLVLTQ